MATPDANERVLRLLEEAAKQIVRAAAEIQAKGIDTAQLSRPVLMIGDVIKELARSSDVEAQKSEPAVESMALTGYNSDRQSDGA